MCPSRPRRRIMISEYCKGVDIMFSSGLWAVLGISFIFLMTTLGSAAVFLFPEHKSGLKAVAMGFSGGVMTAAAVWSLLLPAIEQSTADAFSPCWLPAAVSLLLGALFISCLELLPGCVQGDGLLFAAVTLHNIPEGMAVGLAFALAGEGESLAPALTLAFGIGVQNFPEGAAVSLPLCHGGLRRSRAFFRGVLSGAVEPLFAFLAIAAAPLLYPVMPWLLGFAAGAMLYVSARELLREGDGAASSFAYIGGFALMMLLDVALG